METTAAARCPNDTLNPRFVEPMSLYAATIFVSAFLLFLVQPVIAKEILPWFGGSAAVWITCLVFFQVALLVGYAYSDFIVRRLSHAAQVRLHAALLLVSLVVLPIVPAAHWKPSGGEDPSLLILGLLAVTIGLPYFLLSTTSPLIQAWFARARPGASPYRLFALSNAASMLALIGYPFLLEPWAPTRAQAVGWSIGYGVCVALCVATGWSSLRATPAPTPTPPAPRASAPTPARKSKRKRHAAVTHPASTVSEHDTPPLASRQILWAILAATGTLLLLAVTNHVTQNIASVPLLWIVPLAIYLSTFILCFEGIGWYRRDVFITLLAVALVVMGWVLVYPSLEYRLELHVAVFCIGLFVACMFCHGELARLKPAPKYLTRFYLMIALGGALGSTLVGIVAPIVLPGYFELQAGLVLVACLLSWQLRHDHIGRRALGLASIIVAVASGAVSIRDFYVDTISATRNFYGVLRVRQAGLGNDYRRGLIYGSIQHGMQYRDPKLARYPTTYFGPTSGIGRLLSTRPEGLAPRRVGIIGLGIGTLAAYGLQGDVYRFYDINPEVIKAAQRDFTYLKDSAATVEFSLGDARIALEREPNQQFDILVVDAFFGDAIPVHLLTKEAIGIYLRHLKPGGVIAIHLTNRFVNLIPVVARLVEAHDLQAIHIEDRNEKPPAYASDWMLLSDRRESLARPKLTEAAKPVQSRPEVRVWTDDFSNIMQVLK